MKKKVFILMSRFPYPTEKGDKLRAFYQIKELSYHFEIHLCAISTTKVKKEWVKELEDYCATIDILNLPLYKIFFSLFKNFITRTYPFQVAYFYNKGFKRNIIELINTYNIDHIYCQLIRVAEYVKDIPISKTLDYMDTFSKGIERRMVIQKIRFNPIFKFESIALKRYEHYIYSFFDNAVIISNQDKKFIPHIENDRINVVKNGINLDKFKSSKVDKKIDLLFTGNMSYPPNLNSARFIIDEIMPILWQNQPNRNLYIVGGFPPISLRMKQNSKVTITGWVDNIQEYYNSAKVFIAPMRISIGLQNKILEAMAMKLPCVISNLANNALGAIENKNVLLGETPEEYANQIKRLMEDKELYSKISNQGFELVKSNFSWKKNTETLVNLIKE